MTEKNDSEKLAEYTERIKLIGTLADFKGRIFYPGCGDDFEWTYLPASEMVGMDIYEKDSDNPVCFRDAEKYAKILEGKIGKKIKVLKEEAKPLEGGYDILLDKRGLTESFDYQECWSFENNLKVYENLGEIELENRDEKLKMMSNIGEYQYGIIKKNDYNFNFCQIKDRKIVNYLSIEPSCGDKYDRGKFSLRFGWQNGAKGEKYNGRHLSFPVSFFENDEKDISELKTAASNLLENFGYHNFVWKKYLEKLKEDGFIITTNPDFKVCSLVSNYSEDESGYGTLRRFLLRNDLKEIEISEEIKKQICTGKGGRFASKWEYLTDLAIFQKV